MMWVTVSCGVSTCGKTEEYDADELVASVDQALYEAKAGGRNMVRWREMDRPGTVAKFVANGLPKEPVWLDETRSAP